MATFIPHNTVEWKLEDLRTFRRFTRSLVASAVATGLVLRLYRVAAFTVGAGHGILFLGALVALGLAILLGMATLHLGNYPLRHWLVRAPLWAAVEATTEAVMTVVLVALHREVLGSGRAGFQHVPGLIRTIFIWRASSILLFALLLAAMTQLVRLWMVRRAHRSSTARAVHQEIERHTKEHSRSP